MQKRYIYDDDGTKVPIEDVGPGTMFSQDEFFAQQHEAREALNAAAELATVKPPEAKLDTSVWHHGNLLEWAWTLIANAGGGDWTTQTPEWQHAAASWREVYNTTLGMTSKQPEVKP